MPDTPSPKHGITRPADADFVNSWPALTREIVDWIDPNIATFTEESPRPAAGVSGRMHRAADGTISFDDGSSWIEVARVGNLIARLGAGGDQQLTVARAMLAADVPIVNIGDQIATGRQNLPASGLFAWCNGGLIDRTVYAAFFAEVGHAYNGGVDPLGNMVRLPNKNGRTSIGSGLAQTLTGGAVAGAAAKTRGGRGGEETHVLTVAELASHTHAGTVIDPAAFYGIGDPGAPYRIGNTSATPNFTGGNSPHNNLPPYEVDNWMVRIA